ncbi:hypothetical protein vseg_009859 [Gypsophila vaccaria]
MTSYDRFISSGELSKHVVIYYLLVVYILYQPVWAQPSMSDGLNTGQRLSPSMWLLLVVLIVALFLVGLFSVYVGRCTGIPSTQAGLRTRHIIGGSVARPRRASRGLDPAIIGSFPTFDYSAVKTAKIGRGALECAVCLLEFEDDDTLRLIPKCDHVFHSECIDAWLAGHTTCPVCRANLTEPAGLDDSTPQDDAIQNDTILQVSENANNINDDVEESSESMEQPLRGRVRRSRSVMGSLSFGRSKWIGKIKRSSSTGHVAVKQLENMERFTLRLPNEIRNQIMSGKLGRSTSLVILPTECSAKKGYRIGVEEGTSSKGRRSQSVRSDRVTTRSDQWIFSLAPPFISRASSIATSTKDVVCDSIKGGTLRGSIRGDSIMSPV